MPIYAYRCTTCGHAQDVLQKMSDALLTQCPACGAEAYVKQVTAAGFQLKGSGWYVTDFRGDGKAKKPPEGDGAGDKKGDGAGGDKKGDAAPATSEGNGAAKSGDAAAAPSAPAAAAPSAAAPAAPAPPSGKTGS